MFGVAEKSPGQIPFPFGANHPEVSWHRIQTEHFNIIYHDGLEEDGRMAAAVAESVFPVVTGNLQVTMNDRTDIYLSDLDDIPNAVAVSDSYIFIWMRGILDDMPLGGIRSAGHAKWFRAVITHEFTHIAIYRATNFFSLTSFIPQTVPRWFNEGTARAMEPDGWTSDVDQVLRVATVHRQLDYDLLDPSPLDGTLLYEEGHSFIRYLIYRFGDSVIAKIVHGGRSLIGYNFDDAVQEATGFSTATLMREWKDNLNPLYGAEYAARKEAKDIGRGIANDLDVVFFIAPSPDGTRYAAVARDNRKRSRIYLVKNDSASSSEKIYDGGGIDSWVSWNRRGTMLLFSKSRYDADRTLTHDIYRLTLEGDAERITSGADLTDPIWSPDESRIVAIQKRRGRDRLVLVDPASGAISPLKEFGADFEGDVQLYTPDWSPDGEKIAFSMFDESGHRLIATINADGSGFTRLMDDTLNNRYPHFSPDGTKILFTTNLDGIPDLFVMNVDGTSPTRVTRTAEGVYGTGWNHAGDSVIAIAIRGRNNVRPYVIPESGIANGADIAMEPIIQPKYEAWRTARFALQTPTEVSTNDIPEATGYSTLSGIRSLLPAFPLIAADISSDGDNSGLRLGLLTAWWDPLQVHQLTGYIDYGLTSRQLGGELLYLNNYLPITLALHLDHSLQYKGDVRDRIYYQRTIGGDLTAALWLPAPNSLDIVHSFYTRYEYTKRKPWLRIETEDSLWRGQFPFTREHDVSEIELGYLLESPNVLFRGDYEGGGLVLGDVRYDRLTAMTSVQVPVDDDSKIVVNGTAVAQWGEQLPYEFIGFNRYDQFSSGFSIASIFRQNLRMRGGDHYIYGDRAFVASVGYDERLRWLESYFPFLRPLGLHGRLFGEFGSAWYQGDDITLYRSVGVELRSPLAQNLNLVLGGAIGDEELAPRSDYDVYFRIDWGF